MIHIYICSTTCHCAIFWCDVLSPWCRTHEGATRNKEVSVDKNTATETGHGGRKPGREPKENDQKNPKPTENQGAFEPLSL